MLGDPQHGDVQYATVALVGNFDLQGLAKHHVMSSAVSACILILQPCLVIPIYVLLHYINAAMLGEPHLYVVATRHCCYARQA